MQKNVKVIRSTLTPSQREAFRLIVKHCDAAIDRHERFISTVKKSSKVRPEWVYDKMFVLSGPAGCGKTYLSVETIRFLSTKYNVTITAPTHKAVGVVRELIGDNGINGVEVRTLHSFLKMQRDRDFVTGSEKYVLSKTRDPKKTELLVVDECSMVGDDLFRSIGAVVHREICKAVLFVGDFYQLPPVKGGVSPVAKLRNHFQLTEIVRQAKGSYIISLATEIRERIGRKDYIDPVELFSPDRYEGLRFFSRRADMIKDFCFESDWDAEDRVITSFKNSEVENFNHKVRQVFWQQRGRPQPDEFEVGESVILQEPNVVEGGVLHYNGDEVTLSKAEPMWSKFLGIWCWSCADRKGLPLMIIANKSKQRYQGMLERLSNEARREKDKEKKKKFWRAYYELKDYFVDVKHAYAMTVHKLQGSTVDAVYINLPDIVSSQKDMEMVYRLLYVAVTRASNNITVLMPQMEDRRGGLKQSIAQLEFMLADVASVIN